MAHKRKENRNERGGERKREMRLVRNETNVQQVIGRVILQPGDGAFLDVSPGTIGRALMDQGTLAEPPNARIMQVGPQAPDAKPAEPTETGQFVCPWCLAVTDEGRLAQEHIMYGHAYDILGSYAKTLTGLDRPLVHGVPSGPEGDGPVAQQLEGVSP